MGLGCWTDSNVVRGSAPTRWLGESGVTRLGCCSSRARRLLIRAVVLVIRDDRIVEHVVAMVVEIEGALELGVADGVGV